jgi:hypothetical protein
LFFDKYIPLNNSVLEFLLQLVRIACSSVNSNAKAVKFEKEFTTVVSFAFFARHFLLWQIPAIRLTLSNIYD